MEQADEVEMVKLRLDQGTGLLVEEETSDGDGAGDQRSYDLHSIEDLKRLAKQKPDVIQMFNIDKETTKKMMHGRVKALEADELPNDDENLQEMKRLLSIVDSGCIYGLDEKCEHIADKINKRFPSIKAKWNGACLTLCGLKTTIGTEEVRRAANTLSVFGDDSSASDVIAALLIKKLSSIFV